jgi:hypothetical protein
MYLFKEVNDKKINITSLNRKNNRFDIKVIAKI